jgi:alkyl hydroperoxide reductase subunit AhpC
MDDLARLRLRVLLIAFADESWARAWLGNNDVPFPLLLDRDRRVYRAYGLERSRLRTWSPRTIWYYIRRLAAGAHLQRTHGDPYQLGGDFVVDEGGIVRLAYRSADPSDRPSVERILGALRAPAPARS